MLERSNDQQLSEDLWQGAGTTVRLPGSLSEQFFAPRGPMPVCFDNRRTYHRYYMRGKSLLKRGETSLGVYTIDVSRQGVGFLSPVPLLPKERIRLRLPTVELNLEVARCRRLDDACFACGARFALVAGRVQSTQ